MLKGRPIYRVIFAIDVFTQAVFIFDSVKKQKPFSFFELEDFVEDFQNSISTRYTNSPESVTSGFFRRLSLFRVKGESFSVCE